MQNKICLKMCIYISSKDENDSNDLIRSMLNRLIGNKTELDNQSNHIGKSLHSIYSSE